MGARFGSIGLTAALFVVAACVAHEKNGDAAAAIGDWRTALAEYREALKGEPESPSLRQKYQVAREEAVAGALRKGSACSARSEWSCSLKQADYVLRIDDSNAEAMSLRAIATKGLARQWIAQARAQTARREFRGAWTDLRRAQEASSDPDLATEFREAGAELAAGAADEGERLLVARSFASAIALFEIAVQLDASKAVRLEAARAEYERFREEEYERLAQRGDVAAASKLWSAAAEEYRAALDMKTGGRAGPLFNYCQALAQVESAATRRDFAAAASSANRALQSGQDRQGDAARLLDAVEVRPYAVRVRSVLVKPLRPDQQPWVGPRNPLLGLLLKGIAGAVMPGVGAVVASSVISAAEKIPPENRPTITVEVALPDGRRLATEARKSLYVAYDASFVIAANEFDDRRLTFKVVGHGDRLDDVGVIDVTVADLVKAKSATYADQSIAALELAAEPAPNAADGMATNLSMVGGDANTTTPSQPTQRSVGYRLTGVETQGARGDYGDELSMDGAPDLVVEIEQGGRTVYRSQKAQDQFTARWAPESTYLFIEPEDQITVLVWDIDVQQSDRIIAAYMPAAAVSRGEFVFTTPRNSWVRLRFELRAVGPR